MDSEALRLLEDWIRSSTARKQSFPVYGVGGYFRDRELGLAPKDLDLAVELEGGAKAVAFALKAEFPEALTEPHCLGRGYPIWELQFLADVEFQGTHYECKNSKLQLADTQKEAFLDPNSRQRVSSFGDLFDDCARRDFTVNMLYWDLCNQRLLDPSGRGLEDLKARRLASHPKVDPEKMFSDDPLRILRLFRFEAQLEFGVTDELLNAAKNTVERMKILSAERIRDEMNKTAERAGLAPMIENLDRVGGLEVLIPELLAMKDCGQDQIYHSEGDVFVHTMRVLRNAPRTVLLQWAALLHDIGKPATRSVDGERVKFIGHEVISENLAEVILKRLCFPQTLMKEILLLIRLHLRGGDVLQWASLKPARRLLRELGELSEPWLLLVEADSRASLDKNGEPRLDHLPALRQAFEESRKIPLKKQAILSGHEIMALLKISSGPEVKRYLDLLRDWEDEWAARGEILLREKAMELLADFRKKEESLS